MSSNNAAMAKKRPAGYNTQVYSDGVVVKRNADGTVETYEAGPTSKSSTYRSLVQQRSAPNSHRARRKGTPLKRIPIYSTKYSDDITVKRNADGTVETYETSQRSLLQGNRSGHSVYRTSDGITVKRNADGTVETHESNSSYFSKPNRTKKR